MLTTAATGHCADIVLVDVGPSLGAINRAASVASDHVVVPIAPDRSVLRTPMPDAVPTVEDDPYCLAQLRHYHSLMPLAQEARKPVFALRPADGAFGGHAQAAQRAFTDFRTLSDSILTHVARAAA